MKTGRFDWKDGHISTISRKAVGGMIIFLLFAGVLLWGESGKFFDGKFHLFVFDIPLGDALLLKTPHGKTVFFDGGIDDSVLPELSKVLPFWTRKIDLLVITHPDLDHLAGGLEVLKKYRVENVLLTGVASSSRAFDEFLREIEGRHVPLHFGTKDADFILDGVSFDVLFPHELLIGSKVKKVNETSLVMKASYGKNSFLLTGDIEKIAENEILKSTAQLKSTVLKVAHHGSRGSSLESFLRATHPTYSVISAAEKNRYGHPHAEALERLSRNSFGVFATKDYGTMEFSSDGRNVSFLPERR